MTPMQITFVLSALITLASAVMVVSTRKMIHAAFWLVLSLFGVAMLFAILQAGFFAVVQVLVYIGAIAILIIFAVMLTRRAMQDVDQQTVRGWPWAAGVAVLIFSGLVWVLSAWSGGLAQAPVLESDTITITQLGLALISPEAFVVPFEVASVLLVAAMVGAIYIGRQKA
jgi:NADH-quinone oxidoreductase subunit J